MKGEGAGRVAIRITRREEVVEEEMVKRSGDAREGDETIASFGPRRT
jgi:hypothetical protein